MGATSGGNGVGVAVGFGFGFGFFSDALARYSVEEGEASGNGILVATPTTAAEAASVPVVTSMVRRMEDGSFIVVIAMNSFG